MSYLFLTRFPSYFPQAAADFTYARGLLHALAAIRPVQALAFDRPDLAMEDHPGVTWHIVQHTEPPRWKSLLSLLPSTADRHVNSRYLEAAIDLARMSDAIIVDFIAMYWCVEPIRRALSGMADRPPIIVVTHNHEQSVRWQMVQAETSPVMRTALSLDAWKASRLERETIRRVDGFTAITAADEAALAAESGTPAVVLTPGYEGVRVPSRVIGPDVPPTISIMFNHGSHHKRMALQIALAKLSERGLDRRYRIDVVGGGDNTAFERDFPHFRFMGFVDDLEAYLAGTRLGLVPDPIGGGFKTRVLGYGFNRVPMLALHHAMAGMGFVDGRHMVGVDTLEEMADQVPILLEDFDRLNALQNAAFDHCAANFSFAERGSDLHRFAQALRTRAA